MGVVLLLVLFYPVLAVVPVVLAMVMDNPADPVVEVVDIPVPVGQAQLVKVMLGLVLEQNLTLPEAVEEKMLLVQDHPVRQVELVELD